MRVIEVWSSAGMKGRGKREIPEKTRRPTASSGMIPTCKNSDTNDDYRKKTLQNEAANRIVAEMALNDLLKKYWHEVGENPCKYIAVVLGRFRLQTKRNLVYYSGRQLVTQNTGSNSRFVWLVTSMVLRIDEIESGEYEAAMNGRAGEMGAP
ncbi:hypothetical protein PR048_029059 [Dryococelus australis]|uniref:Uncharacterized protein n=1 Tax=Dryococelus australis TaxID=614101 RepID=A0ABQ9GCQ2_9NEOP|nr:hypothetical protein PR048_029059 [Dryococelus australis]